MNRAELAAKIIALIEKEYSVSVTDPGAEMMQSLGLDSLDVTEMLFNVEETFGANISTAELSKCRSLDHVIDLLYTKLNCSEEPSPVQSPSVTATLVP